MNTEMIECPYCRIHVIPTNDATCPACRNNLLELHGSESNAGENRVDETAWDRYQKSPPGSPAIAPAREFAEALVTFTPRLIATPAIIVINVLVFTLMVIQGVDFFAPTGQSVIAWGANFGPLTMNGQWWRLMTYMFLHFGIIHLVLNMYVLWDCGRLVERLVGNAGFVILYLISGIAGGMASLAWNPIVVSAGASGAVFGVAGALLGFLINRRDTVPVAVLQQLRNSIIAFVFYNLIFGLQSAQIDMAAHVGGFLAGVVCGLLQSQPLSIEMRARRWQRNLTTTVVGSVALLLATMVLPKAPADIGLQLRQFAEVETKVLGTYQDVVSKAQQGTISDPEIAQTLEQEIIPTWIEMRDRIEQLLKEPHADRELLGALLRYMQAKLEGWQLQAAATREGDAEKMKRGNERIAESDQIIQEISALSKRGKK